MADGQSVDGGEILGRTQALWEKVNLLGGMEDYQDENWCDEWNPDTYLLQVLTWGGWHETRQEQVWLEVMNIYRDLAKPLPKLKPLNTLGPGDLQKLKDAYPYKWQKAFLGKIVSYLQRRGTTLTDLVQSFMALGPRLSLAEMEIALGTTSTKIASCFLRDSAKLDEFPIDSRVKEVLEHHGLPADSWAMMEACERLRFPTRVFARAVYSQSAELLKQ
jgi:hypothetical protein